MLSIFFIIIAFFLFMLFKLIEFSKHNRVNNQLFLNIFFYILKKIKSSLAHYRKLYSEQLSV